MKLMNFVPAAALLVSCASAQHASIESLGCQRLSYDEFRMSTTYVGSIPGIELVLHLPEQACLTEVAAEKMSLNRTICSEIDYLSSDVFSTALIARISQIVISREQDAIFMPLVSISHIGQRCSVIVDGHQQYAIFTDAAGAAFFLPVSKEALTALNDGY